ncbi:hypothetical protein Bhyg_01790 [Pseudolycoriella hygida]|uniref:Uncharacterized protein n=1 Tax=Pseudolycoriella hygida TaxID=35572 RepID=A0A9Q0NA49_9DIPT|nr:hypothetical protein Bhyg_01790 [Pseudolycoriella hygida]
MRLELEYRNSFDDNIMFQWLKTFWVILSGMLWNKKPFEIQEYYGRALYDLAQAFKRGSSEQDAFLVAQSIYISWAPEYQPKAVKQAKKKDSKKRNRNKQMKQYQKSSADDELKAYLSENVADPDLLVKEKSGIDGVLGWWKIH